MTRPLGVILAGGLATRMGGGDKSLLDLGGRSILQHVIERLRPQVEEIALSANGAPSRFENFGLPVVPDSIEGFAGPLAGVLAGMDYAVGEGFDRIVTVAADTPFFPTNLVALFQIAADRAGSGLVLAATPDEKRGILRHPTFGLWPVSLREDLRQALQDGLRKVVLWTDGHNGTVALFDSADEDPFFNVNTPDDLTAARKIMAKGAA